MTPSDVPLSPDDLAAIKSLLQSGGNIAAIACIWIGGKLLKVVKDFLTGIADTLKANVTTNEAVIKAVNELRADVQLLNSQLAIQSGLRGPRVVPHDRPRGVLPDPIVSGEPNG